MSARQQSRNSGSFSSPMNEDVKPNVQLIQTDVSTRSSSLQDSLDVKQPPPGFSQSCNHKILVSKSFDCKTGMTQVENQPNGTNHSNSTLINSNTQQSSNHLPNLYNTPISNGINGASSFFESFQRRHHEPDLPLYQSTFSQNSSPRPVIEAPQVLGNYLNYHSTSVDNVNNQTDSITHAFSQNFVPSWQQPSRTSFFNPPGQPNSPFPHQSDASYNSSMLLPPLHLPPPSCSSSSSSNKKVTPAQNSFDSYTTSNCSKNGFGTTIPQNISNRVQPPLNTPPPIFPSGNHSTTDIPPFSQNSFDFISTSKSSMHQYNQTVSQNSIRVHPPLNISPPNHPPLNIPPPNFPLNPSMTKIPPCAQSSFNSISNSPSSIDGYSKTVPQNRSNKVHSRFNTPPPSFSSGNPSTSKILPCDQNSFNSNSTSLTSIHGYSKTVAENRPNRVYSPLNRPPPSFPSGNPPTTSIASCAKNSFTSDSISKNSILGYSNSVLQKRSDSIPPPLNALPPNLFPNATSTVPYLQTLNSQGPCYDNDFRVPFDVSVPPPTFAVPSHDAPSNITYTSRSIPQIKSETPDNECTSNPSSHVVSDFNIQVYNGVDNSQCTSSNSHPTLKTRRSPSRHDCDYYKTNRGSSSSQVTCPDTLSNNVRSSSKPSGSRFRRSSSKEKYSDNGTKKNTKGSRRSRSKTRSSRSRNERSRSRNRRSRSRNGRSRSRNRRSRSRNGRSGSRNRRSRSRNGRSSSSRSTLPQNQSSARLSKRSHSRSRSRQSQSRSESKRFCTRRSRSKSLNREDESKSSSTYRNNKNKNSKSFSYRSEHDLNKRNRSRSKSKSKPVVSHSSRSRSKTKFTSPIKAKESLSSLEKWRMNNCSSELEMTEKLNTLAAMKADQIIEEEKKIWTRSAPADFYYTKSTNNGSCKCTQNSLSVCNEFESVIKNFASAKELKKPFDYTANRKKIKRKCSHCQTNAYLSSDSDCSNDSSGEEGAEEDNWLLELQLKQNHPDRLHPELWFNDKGEMNDGPVCRCSSKSRRSGIRHNIYAGEEKQEYCDPLTNNVDKLYHYRVTVSPPTNFLINKPTFIEHDNHEFIFEGFSLFSHHPLKKLPTCRVIRFNIQYTIVYIEEKVPEAFSVGETELFFNYLFHEVLELVDLDLKSVNNKDGCPQFHIMPRFVRELKNNGKELLPMYRVLEFFTSSFVPVISEEVAKVKDDLSTYDWQDFADGVKGMIIVKPGAKPCAMRVDQLDRESESKDIYPDAVHFGSRPLQLCFAGSPDFQKLWKSYVKLRHLVANKPKRTDEDKRRLAFKEQKLQEMRTNSKMKRGVTVAISCRDFYRTGIMCDMVQHAMLIPVLICHLRFHQSLKILEDRIQYKFKNRYLLQLALTHPSYRENFGTNPDHARNSLSNCGVRQPEYGDRRIHFQNTRKRGINTLINIMSKLGRKVATESNITHNERLEFLGDAVVEFITSIHLFHVFPEIEEGGLATYRAAIVQNQHLAHLAKKLGLEDFMLYAHGSDLCHEVELKHAMANCFEALMGALFLDGGIHVADQVFSCVLYKENEVRFKQWMNYPKHPLQEQEPDGDRQWVEHSPLLKKLQYLEHSSGVVFYHIRLLARVFTTRSMGYTNLTLGSNQRLEFLGDTVLQLITSDYLYNHFPEHHEGHLSLLRSSLVNNRTQSVVCNDIGMPFFANMINPKVDLKMKDRADLLEALLGAMYIDKGMEACEQFCKVCFFPRLQYFILNQEWNDPKSKLQQCCLTLRTLDGGEPDIPIYKVIEHVGPTNSRSYTVAVYFKNERLAKATGNSIQQAEMNAAKVALEKCPSICPQLDHQKRVIAKSLEMQKHDGVVVDVLDS